MTSPARRHIEFHSARAAHATSAAAGSSVPGHSAPAMPTEGAAAQEYRLLLMALGEDLRHLHNIQSLEAKIELKRTLLPRYADWIEGALGADGAAQDEIVATMLVWAIDVADWPLAIRLARHVLKYGVALPERYRRTPGTLIAEEVAEAGLAPTPSVDLQTLQQVDDLTADIDMPDEVRAKLKKSIGLAFKAQLDAFDPTADHAIAGGRPALAASAIAHFTRALELDAKSGVKALIQQVTRAAKAAEQEPVT